jgi:DNA invertase Pin-like site-specific DNA recombinase
MVVPMAYSYIRFSNGEQKKGDSLRRQEALRDAYLARHPKHPPLDTKLNLKDLGVSAFKGKNALFGNLKLFLDEIAAGNVAPGSWLIVESLDRLSRQGIDEGYDLCKRILKAGVHIVTLSPERDFGPEAVKGLTKGALELQLILERAAEESERKAERLRAAWLEKKRRARDGLSQKATERMGDGCRVLTSLVPAWVRREGGKLVLIPDKAKAVRLVFRLAAQGYGGQRLAKKLVADGVPPLGDGPWNRTYLSRILRDRRAVGEYQPKGAGRKREGAPVSGYFPAAVTEDEFDAARACVVTRTHHRGKANAPINLFARLLVDARDGSPYFMTGRKDRGRGLRHVLMNMSAFHGRATCRTVSYPAFEAAVLSLLRELKPADVSGKDPVLDEVTALGEAVGRKASKAAGLQTKLDAEVEKGDPDGLARDYRKGINTLEAELAKLREELREARAKAATPLAETWREAKTLAEVVAKAPDQEEAKLRLKVALRRVVETIRLFVVARGYTRYVAVRMAFAGGGARWFWVYVKTPRGNQSGKVPGRWWAGSFLTDGAGQWVMDTPAAQDRAEEALVDFIDRCLGTLEGSVVESGDPGDGTIEMITAGGQVPAAPRSREEDSHE